MRDRLGFILSRMFSFLGLSVLVSGSVVFFLFAVGMVLGGNPGVLLAALADRVMNISLWLALLTTIVGMMQMYVARETALQMDQKKTLIEKQKAIL